MSEVSCCSTDLEKMVSKLWIPNLIGILEKVYVPMVQRC